MNTKQDLSSCPEFQALLQKIRALTESNCHTEALITIAKFFDIEKLVKAFEAIDELHCNFYSFLHPALSDVRKDLKNALFFAIEEEHGPEIRKQVYDCL